MSASNLELVRHILTETTFILHYTENKDKAQLLADEVLCRAIIRSIEIIGEASKKIDEEFKSVHNYIEWRKMAGARDKLIYDLNHFLKQII